MRRNLSAIAVVAVGALLSTSILSAQTTQPIRRSVSSSARGVAPLTGPDQLIGARLALLNKAEIELSEFAREQTDIPEVQDFATLLIDDHRLLLNRLIPLVPDAGRGLGDAETDRRFRQAEQTRGTELEMTRLEREILNETNRAAKRDLARRDGLDFAFAFVGMQAVLHQQALAEHRVLLRYARDPAAQQLIEQAIGVLESHADHADHLMQQLQGSHSHQDGRQGAASGDDPDYGRGDEDIGYREPRQSRYIAPNESRRQSSNTSDRRGFSQEFEQESNEY